MNRKVFLVVLSTKYVIDGATEFGKIHSLYNGHLNPFNVEECITILSHAFDRHFNAENDFLCMTGQTLILSYALSVALCKYNTLNILLFDATTNRYRSRTISVKECLC